MYQEHVLEQVSNVFLPDIFMIIYIMAFIAMYIGMINPSLVLGWLRVRCTKTMVLLVYGSVFVISLTLNILISY